MLVVKRHPGNDVTFVDGERNGADRGVAVRAVDPEPGVDMCGCAG